MVLDIERHLEFIYTPLFDRTAQGLLDDEAMRQVENILLVEPRTGDLVARTGGVRKLRAALPGRGKRGGARVVYLYVEVRARLYFLLAYRKNQQLDLTAHDKRALRMMVMVLEEER